MAAIVTDQFRINNASNFLGDINDPSNSYYVFVGLSNPGISNAYGRTDTIGEWDSDNTRPNPTDNFNYLNHTKDTMIFGKKINIDNARRVIRKESWTKGTQYEIYRHDYHVNNQSPKTFSSRLYDAKYYVINKDYNVYICIDNGSSGINTTGNLSQNEPLFTGLEPSAAAGDADDGYIWKYLFTVAPSDIIKFDATEYIPLPNNWESSTDAQIKSVRDSGNADINNNQIKSVYIDQRGNSYSGGLGQEFKIIGDGSGAKVIVDVEGTQITKTQVSVGGKGYTYGMVDLSTISENAIAGNTPAKLIPIIPPSKGHGYDLYKELGADRVLIYARFDDSTKDFPVDAQFGQIGIIKNPTSIGSTSIYQQGEFSSVSSIYLNDWPSGSIDKGTKITQEIQSGGVTVGKAVGYIVSFDIILDNTTNRIAVLKYYQDRSLYFNSTTGDQTDYSGISTYSGSNGTIYPFQSNAIPINSTLGTFTINTNFSGITTNPTGNKVIELGTQFTDGISSSEINNQSGDIIYLDNRALVKRDKRQKEDIKVILEF